MKLFVWLLTGIFLTTNIAIAQPGGSVDDAKAFHLLNRITFGPGPGDLAYVKQLGLKGFIESQLNPLSLPESAAVNNLVASSSTNRLSNEQLIEEFKSLQKQIQEAKKANGDNATDNSKIKEMTGYYRQLRQLDVATKLARCIDSPRQLQEVMTEFWFNHFNVFLNKGMDTILVDSYENQAIRPNALGNFRNLVEDTCHHPAMLFYLDNWENTAPNSPGSKGRFTGLNENYARELMELHTLGVDGGYTQKDVTELARVLTGLSLPMPQRQQMQMRGGGGGGGGFGRGGRFGQMERLVDRGPQVERVGNFGAYFYPQRHDFGDKVILGRHIKGSGEREIEECIDMLVNSPATAHHVCFQLAQYFVCDNPPDNLVNKLSNKFTQTHGDIKSVLRELFYSSEFWNPQYEKSKYKTPLRYVVSTLRASRVRVDNYGSLDQFLRLQGQPMYGCITPDGYKNTKEAWLNADGLIRRINFATAVGTGKLPGEGEQLPEYREVGAAISGGKFSANTVAVVGKAPEVMKTSVVLGSPEFMFY